MCFTFSAGILGNGKTRSLSVGAIAGLPAAGAEKESACEETQRRAKRVSAVCLPAWELPSSSSRAARGLDTSLLPQPEDLGLGTPPAPARPSRLWRLGEDWNAKRRFERRFDESLIVEMEPGRPEDLLWFCFAGCVLLLTRLVGLGK